MLKEARNRIRNDSQEIAGNIFVVDGRGKLVGSIRIEDLISSEPTDKIKDIKSR